MEFIAVHFGIVFSINMHTCIQIIFIIIYGHNDEAQIYPLMQVTR